MTRADERQKGAWATCAPSGDHHTFTIFLILTTMLLLSQIHTTHGISCYVSRQDSAGNVEQQESVNNALCSNTRDGNDWCFLVYTITGKDDRNRTKWNLEPNTYVAGGDKNLSFDIDVCANKIEECKVLNTSHSVACCCNSNDNCNGDANMNPTAYYEQQLKNSNNQICRVDYEPNKRIHDCTRLTGQQESAKTPSKCLSVLADGSGTPTLGCAHDDTGDRCDWTNGENGVCRISKNEELQCCCSGAFCNGDAMMNMACRSTYKHSSQDDLRYGNGLCAALRPPTITTNTKKGEEASTTDGSNTLMWALIGAGIAVLLLIIIIVVALCCWRRKKKKQSAFVTVCGPADDAATPGSFVTVVDPADVNKESSNAFTLLDSVAPTEADGKPSSEACTRLDSRMQPEDEGKPLSDYEAAESKAPVVAKPIAEETTQTDTLK